MVSDFAKCTDDETTGTGVTEFPMTESASERMNGSTSPVYIADTGAIVKEDSRKDSHKRRRFTGKAMKHSTCKPATSTAIRSVGTFEGMAFGSACEVLGGESHDPEHVKDANLLQVADRLIVERLGITDYVLLYFTLVTDKVLLHGYWADFVKLEQAARRSAERKQKLATKMSDAEAEMQLTISRKQKLQESVSSSSAADQLVVAASLRPKWFRTKWQQSCFEGRTARKDAEASGRIRWITLLADLLKNTGTPMGRLIQESPSNIQLLSSGLRAGTLSSRVRAAQKFLAWLATAHNVAFPIHWKQLIEYLQVRLSEPCVRGALEATHRSFLFLQEAVEASEKLTDSAFFDVSKKELLAAALPGNPPRQAPRFPTILIAAFEDNVMSADVPVFWRAMSWWLLLQSWATLRFFDHRGITPTEVSVSFSGLNGKLTRTKVSGPDKRHNFRLLVVHPSAYVHQKDWLVIG